jgi:hypothetical protein
MSMVVLIPTSKGCLHSDQRLTLIFGRHDKVWRDFFSQDT